ncbi:Eco57I restriction-modification methylase domain-containing protein [Ideonella sp. DXS22W]|uniref:site-specific DNA-methyltransferase (adenine-specific) n=1 Tax=Pseudaquabacterium inlustre TaxID=2984192 RepID=A0ABU9CBC1_9BURK
MDQFAEWLAAQETFNESAYWLATAYAIWVGDATRTARSLYFTPPRLADRVIKNLVTQGASLTQHHWHDPACGGAAFLVPIAQGMAKACQELGLSARATLKKIEESLSGSDLDETLIYLSQQFLLMALAPLIAAAGHQPKVSIRCADGLTARGVNGAYDVVACNPPYRKLKATEVARYGGRYATVIEGQPNIYGLFIDRALSIARRGGLIGLLTPTSFLSGTNFSKLRTKLLSHSDVLQIDMLSDRTSMFIDVEQETAITTLRSREPSRAVATTTSVAVLGNDGDFATAGTCLLPNSGRPWAIPRSPEDAALLLAAEQCEARLRDYGYVARVGHLVAYRDERVRHAARPPASKGKVVFPLVWATDISPQGQFIHGREQRLARPELFVEVDAVSQPGVTRRPSVLLQRLTSSDQRRRLVAAPVPADWLAEHGGFVSENHVIVLEQIAETPWLPQVFARLLQTETVDRVFRSMSGASNVSLFELNELPLPRPEALNPLDALEEAFDAVVERAYLGYGCDVLSNDSVGVSRHGHQ